MNAIDPRIRWIAAGLAVLLLAVAALSSLASLSPPALEPRSGEIGPRGPLQLVFAQPVRSESAAGRVELVDDQGNPVAGRVEVRGTGVWWYPNDVLRTNQAYTLRLTPGITSAAGLRLRSMHEWAVRVRPAEVLYLSSTASPELWAAVPGSPDQPPRQLTFTQGRVYDYDAAPDGSRILYSAYNSEGGIDLWQMGRVGESPERLLPCRADLCFNPALSPDGALLAYSRRPAGAFPGQDPGPPQLWLFDLRTGGTEALSPDPNLTGILPVWSPDGLHLAFSGALDEEAYIYQRDNGALISIPASLNGPLRWFPDSRRIFLSIIEGGGSDEPPYVQVFALDVQTRAQEQVLGPDFHLMDYSLPEWSPDGTWLAVAMRRVDSGPGKALWRVRLDGSQGTLISPGELFTNGAYSWDPQGEQLVFQRFPLGTSRGVPQVLLWSEALGEPVVIAEDAALPRWLP